MTAEVNGIIIALLELSIFFGTTVLVKKKTEVFKHVDNFSYFWLSFTVLTGIWEICFILNYDNITVAADQLITIDKHAKDVALRFYIEEASIRAGEIFDAHKLIDKLGFQSIK